MSACDPSSDFLPQAHSFFLLSHLPLPRRNFVRRRKRSFSGCNNFRHSLAHL